MLTSSHSNDWSDRPPPLVAMLAVPFCIIGVAVACVGIGGAIAQVATDNIPGRS